MPEIEGPSAELESDFLGDVGEGAVAVVVIEAVASALEAARAAGDRNAAVLAVGAFAKAGEMI